MRNNLECRRIAAYALNAITKSHQLGAFAHVFKSDTFSDWEVKSDWEVFALIDQREVAEIYITGNTARIVIVNWYDLIRREHINDFNPNSHGIEIDHRHDPVTKDPFPDAEYEIDFNTNEIPGFDLPENRIHNAVYTRPPRVVASDYA